MNDHVMSLRSNDVEPGPAGETTSDWAPHDWPRDHGGEMAARIAGFDWAATSLGPAAGWPQSLRMLTGIMLDAKQPMQVAWGEDRILIYNDAYAALLGSKHPAALGRPHRDVWFEARDHLTPLLDRVFEGQSVQMDDLSLVVERDGLVQEAHFAFSYTPVRNEAGDVAGLFCACMDITEQVRSARRNAFRRAFYDGLSEIGTASEMGAPSRTPGPGAGPSDVMRFAARLLAEHLAADRVGYAEIDPAGECFSVQHEWRADHAASLAGSWRLEAFGAALVDELRAGRILAFGDTGAHDVPLAAENMSGDVAETYGASGTRAAIVAPLLKQGHLEAALFVHCSTPRRWTRSDELLVQDVAERSWAAAERLRAEAALRDGEAFVRLLLNSTAEGFYSVDRDGITTLCNPAFLAMLGFASADDAIGRKLHDVIHHSHPDGSRYDVSVCPIYNCARTGVPAHVVEELFYRLDGSALPVEYWAHPIIRDGELRGAICTFLDVTERARAAAALRESEMRFRMIADAAPVPMWVTAPDGTRAFINRAYANFLGIAYDEALRFDWRSVIHPEDAARIFAEQAEKEGSMQPFTLEARYRNAAGEWRWLRSESQPRSETGEAGGAGFIGVAYDITLVKQAALDLQRMNEALEARVEDRTRERDRMWRMSGDLMDVCTADGKLLAVNHAWFSILGWSEAYLLTANFLDLVHPDDVQPTLAELSRLGHGIATLRFENRFRRTDGEYRLISWTAAPEDGRFYAIGRDITEQRHTEEALRQAQKMEAVGQLTGGLAHDFNNLLTGITGSLELLQLRVKQGRLQELDRYIVAAQGASMRAAALTHRLLAFSRRQTLEPRATDLNQLIAGMGDLIRRTVNEAIAIDTKTSPELWITMVDPNQLENALLNLCINARDAMPDGGLLTIATHNLALDDRAAREQELQAGDYVTLCVTDTGRGMTPEVVRRAFDPFYTTKPIGMGTGLGLSMIYGFVRQSRGQARIRSEPGHGTAVCLYLPRHHGDADDAANPPAGFEARPREGGTALLVDDEPTIRMLVAEVLHMLGYQVVEAANGADGMQILEAPGQIDLLVTDVGLPGNLNGRQVADAGRALRPGLKVLFITGYAENAVFRDGLLEPGMRVLAKPFTVEDLASRIADLVD